MRALPLILACVSCLLPGVSLEAREAGIPFEFRDGLIWVKVTSPGSATPLNFLLDSGAGSTVLSAAAAHRLHVAAGPAVTAQRVGGDVPAYHAQGFEASLDGMDLSRSPLVMDLSHTSSFCCRPIDGLIGQDFLRGRVVQINFKNDTIRVLDRSQAEGGCVVTRIKLDNCAFCVALSVNGASPRWARLDTGCDDGLHWVGGGSDSGSSVQIGTEHLSNVKTAWHRSAIYPGESGLLGNGVLSNYLVTIDGVRGRLLLKRT